jgi:hypothetical protein
MDRSAIFWTGRLVVAGFGVVLMFVAIRLLGRVRAAASWPTADPVPTFARPLGWTGLLAGLAGLAAAAALSLSALANPALVPPTPRAWLLAAIGALAALLVAGSAVGRLLEKAELAVLIRTRSGAGEPAAPEGQPGWVYQDAGGDWYLAVATGTGQRLVRLTDFTLVPDRTARAPLALQGSVEISVYPVA